MRLAALNALVTLLLPALSYAQASDTEVAKQRFETGQLNYERGEYEKALAEFEEAYRLAPRPELQYNIAQAHERLLAFESAIAAYQAYLAGKPEARDRKVVESRIEFLKKQIAQKNAAAARPPPEALATGTVSPTSELEPRSRWKRTVGWVAIGVGGAALATGLVFGLIARNKANDLEDANDSQQSWDDAQQLQEDGERAETISIVGLVLGGVAAAGGTVLLLLDRSEGRSVYSFNSGMIGISF